MIAYKYINKLAGGVKMYPYNIFKQSDAALNIEGGIDSRRPQKKSSNNNKRQPPQRKQPQEKQQQKPVSSIPSSGVIDEKILDMVLEAIADERGYTEYYTKLMKMAKSQDEKNILNEIRIDGQKHEKIFRRIYYILTGKEVLVETEVKSIGNNIKDEYKKSIFRELETVEFHKKLHVVMKNQDLRNMLYDVITDKQAHAIKLTYLNSLF